MRESRCRPFTIGDALILVAATAAGLGVVRRPGWVDFPDLGKVGTRAQMAYAYSQWVGQAQLSFLPVLAAWTFALLLIRARRPRRALRRCVREPGALACCAATAGLLVNTIWVLAMAVAYHPDPTVELFRGFDYLLYSVHTGFAVIGGWVALVLARGWRPVPCWIDRLGRALGGLWVAMIGFHMLFYLVRAWVLLWMPNRGG